MTDQGASALEARNFLLESLDDLEAEYQAGDLDETDYLALKADYTTRAAAAIRRVNGEQRATRPDAQSSTRWRTAGWLVAVAALATVAGIWIAQFSGSRQAGDSITGDIRTTSRELLVEAQQTFGGGDLEGAIEIYDQVLEIQPSNTEALAYKAWFLRLSGDTDAARPLIEDAVAIDPQYADARVFATVIALDVGDIDAARNHLAAFDELDAPPFVAQLVTSQGLRTRLGEADQADALERVGPVMLVPDPPRFLDTDFTVSDVLLAAEALAAQGEVFTGLQLVELVLSEVPDDPEALAGYGWLLGRSASVDEPAPAEVALPFLDRALAVDPEYPQALVYRSFVLAFMGEIDAAAADLAVFDSLVTQPGDLKELITVFDLRAQLGVES